MLQYKNQTLHIACAIDDSFAYPLSVMLVSVLENHKHLKVKIHLFSASLNDKYIKLYETMVTSYQQEFAFYHLEESIFSSLRVNNRISYATYYRLLMPDHIESSVERFLYLDADIIVVSDLSPLFNTNLQNKILGAINDIAAIDWNMHQKHHIPDQYLYFNAGVLLIDKNLWIECNATEKVLAYLDKNKDLCDYHDQDGLNGSLYDQRLELPPIWNSQIGLHFIESSLLNKVYNGQQTAAIKAPVVVHFNGIEKPWHYVSEHPSKKDFIKYANMVSGFIYNDKPTLKKALKRVLLYKLIGWGRVNKHYYYKTRPVN